MQSTEWPLAPFLLTYEAGEYLITKPDQVGAWCNLKTVRKLRVTA